MVARLDGKGDVPTMRLEEPHLSIADAVHATTIPGVGRSPADPLEESSGGPAQEQETLPIEVRVVSRSAPISKAVVSIHGLGHATVMGETDEAGVLRGRYSRSASAVVAQAEGFETGHVRLGAETSVVTLELDAEGVILGRVLLSDGTPAREGVRVAAWLDGHPPGDVAVRVASESHRGVVPEVVVRHTDKEGRFRIDGLSRQSNYTVTAGSPGAIATEVKGIQPGPEEILLELEWLFGVVVDLVDSDGEPLHAGERLFGRGPVWSTEEDSVTAVTNAMPSLSLARVESRLLGGEGRRLDRQLILYRSRDRSDKVAVQFEVEVPGYQPAWTELNAYRLDQETRRQVIPLVRLSSQWGAARIASKGLPIDVVSRRRPLGMIFLTNGTTTFNFGVPVPCDEYEVGHIPVGEYRWRFENKDWPFSYPPQPGTLAIGPTPSELVLDFSGLGGLSLDVKEIDGRPYTGAIRFSVVDPVRRMKSYLAFESTPYVAYGLPPGEYSVALDWAPGRLQGGGEELLCIVLPEETTGWALTLMD